MLFVYGMHCGRSNINLKIKTIVKQKLSLFDYHVISDVLSAQPSQVVEVTVNPEVGK